MQLASTAQHQDVSVLRYRTVVQLQMLRNRPLHRLDLMSESNWAADSFHHSLGLVLVRLGSLAPMPIGEGGLGGATGDAGRGGV